MYHNAQPQVKVWLKGVTNYLEKRKVPEKGKGTEEKE